MKKILLILSMLAFVGASGQISQTFKNVTINDTLKTASDSVLLIKAHLVPTSDSSLDLGTDPLRWNKLYVDTVDANVIGGTAYPQSSVLFSGSDGQIIGDSVYFAYDSANNTFILATDSAKTTAIFNANELDGTNWLSTNWTGSYAGGFTHTPGNTSELSRQIPGLVAGNTYLFSCDVTGLTVGVCVIGIGNKDIIPSAAPHSSIYENTTYTFIVTVTDTGRLKFVPQSNFDGTINNITLQLLSSSNSPITSYRDSLGSVSTEFRTTAPSINGVFFGKNAGQYSQTGLYNIHLGNIGMERITSGNRNTGSGSFAFMHNLTGSNNTYTGYASLLYCNGNANSGFGSFAQIANGTGDSNTAIGFGAGYHNIKGSNNVWVGAQTRGFSTTSQYNSVVVGYGAGYNLGSPHTGTGVTSGNILIGYKAGYNLLTGGKNIAIGYNLDLPSTTDSFQMTIGNLIFATGGFGTDTTVGTGNVGVGTNGPQFGFHVARSMAIDTTPEIAVGATGLSLVMKDESTKEIQSTEWAQGVYLPVDSAGSNVDGVTPDTAFYTRVGNVVTVSGVVEIDPTTTLTPTFFYMNVPVFPANWNTNRAGGTFAAYIVNESGGIIMGGPTSVLFQFNPTATGANIFSYTYSYRIE